MIQRACGSYCTGLAGAAVAVVEQAVAAKTSRTTTSRMERAPAQLTRMGAKGRSAEASAEALRRAGRSTAAAADASEARLLEADREPERVVAVAAAKAV